MHLLSVVGVKTSSGRRTTIVQSTASDHHKRLSRLFKLFSKTTIILFCTSIALFLQIREYQPIVVLQSTMIDALSPLTEVVSRPIHWMTNVQSYFQSKEQVIFENQRLKQQNDFLLRRYHNTQQAMTENVKLREALHVQSSLVDDMLTIQISHHTFDGYSQTFYATFSDQENITKNNPVLTTTGHLVGRVMDVSNAVGRKGKKLTRIMPINDPSSRIPVKVEGTNQQAILKGCGERSLELVHIENPGQLQLGQKLVTSGVGGIYPAGIPVAEITHVAGTITAKSLGKLEDQAFALVLGREA